MQEPKITKNINLDETSRITGEQFVQAVLASAKMMDSINPKSVRTWTDTRDNNGRRIAVTVEFRLRWNVTEKFYFYQLASGFAGEPYYFDATSWNHRFVMKSDPKSIYGSEHFEAIDYWAYLFSQSLQDRLHSNQPALAAKH